MIDWGEKENWWLACCPFAKSIFNFIQHFISFKEKWKSWWNEIEWRCLFGRQRPEFPSLRQIKINFIYFSLLRSLNSYFYNKEKKNISFLLVHSLILSLSPPRLNSLSFFLSKEIKLRPAAVIHSDVRRERKRDWSEKNWRKRLVDCLSEQLSWNLITHRPLIKINEINFIEGPAITNQQSTSLSSSIQKEKVAFLISLLAEELKKYYNSIIVHRLASAQ